MTTATVRFVALASFTVLASACSSGGGPGTGAAGNSGAAGTAGVTGAAGTTGAAGATGAAGTTGVAGTTGAAGTTANAGTTGTAGTTATAGTTGAAGATGTAGATGAAGAGSVACGTQKPDVSGITGSEGLVIAADGTIYFSQPQAIGRLRPGAASTPEKAWAKVTGATTVWGLTLDRANKLLYAGSPTTSTIYKVTVEDTPTVTPLVTKAGQPNGLTMGPDGAVYYSDFSAMGDVYRATPDGTRTKVTTTVLPQANGLAFGPDGALYVDLFTAGSITKLTLANGLETARADFVVKNTVAAADGLAFDAAGNAYVGFGGGVSRVSADGKTLTNLVKGGTANVEFGAGALDCKDLYAVAGGKLVRVANDTAGAPVPWHLSP
jgi:sugar lactone lactonase YvrE